MVSKWKSIVLSIGVSIAHLWIEQREGLFSGLWRWPLIQPSAFRRPRTSCSQTEGLIFPNSLTQSATTSYMHLPKAVWQGNSNPWLCNMTLFHTAARLQDTLLAIFLSTLPLLKCRLILGNKEIILDLTHLFAIFLRNNWTIQHKGFYWNPMPIIEKVFLGKSYSFASSHTYCVCTHHLFALQWLASVTISAQQNTGGTTADGGISLQA